MPKRTKEEIIAQMAEDIRNANYNDCSTKKSRDIRVLVESGHKYWHKDIEQYPDYLEKRYKLEKLVAKFRFGDDKQQFNRYKAELDKLEDDRKQLVFDKFPKEIQLALIDYDCRNIKYVTNQEYDDCVAIFHKHPALLDYFIDEIKERIMSEIKQAQDDICGNFVDYLKTALNNAGIESKYRNYQHIISCQITSEQFSNLINGRDELLIEQNKGCRIFVNVKNIDDYIKATGDDVAISFVISSLRYPDKHDDKCQISMIMTNGFMELGRLYKDYSLAQIHSGAQNVFDDFKKECLDQLNFEKMKNNLMSYL